MKRESLKTRCWIFEPSDENAPGQNGEMSQGHFLKVQTLERLY